ncbi:MAG: TetR/AcrR family transcriptional regulator [Atopostipes sp.]|nr:TetR/AcrR family transcriptional regulator [Atopostipes sp.]
MLEGIQLTKREKSLYLAAYELFREKGITDTAINDIVKKADVAKGTFYTYFKNKGDILERITLNKSMGVLHEAMTATEKEDFELFNEKLLFFIDYIVKYFEEDPIMLKLIYKNLSWGLFRKVRPQYKEMDEIYQMFKNEYEDSEMTELEIESRLLIIVDLVGSVCYNSIILDEPANIDEMRPILLHTVENII